MLGKKGRLSKKDLNMVDKKTQHYLVKRLVLLFFLGGGGVGARALSMIPACKC